MDNNIVLLSKKVCIKKIDYVMVKLSSLLGTCTLVAVNDVFLL